MLSGNGPISANEHRILLSVTFFCFALHMLPIIVSFFVDTVPGPNFGIYSIFDQKEIMAPIYSFPLFLFCTLLAVKIDSPWSTVALVLLLPLSIFFDWWLVDTRVRIANVAMQNPGFEFKQFHTVDFVLAGGSIPDLLTLILVNVLIVWHVSILFRLRFGNS